MLVEGRTLCVAPGTPDPTGSNTCKSWGKTVWRRGYGLLSVLLNNRSPSPDREASVNLSVWC